MEIRARGIRLVAAALLTLGPCWAGSGALHAQGLNLAPPSRLAQLVPAAEVEAQARQDYAQLRQQAIAKGALVPDADPAALRLQAIAHRIIAQSGRYNPRATQWQWEVMLLRSKQLNAFCLPGGKIAFYTGLLQGLRLSDDEAAAVMGHEVAHALREHARERIAKSQLTRIGAGLLGSLIGDGRYSRLFDAGGTLLTLKFSRSDETEADLVGLELAARAGYDPRAAIGLWQKMAAASEGAPPQWLSTHPSGGNRIAEIEAVLPQVMPLYEAARAR